MDRPYHYYRMELVRLQGICRNFGPTRALVDVCLEVGSGEVRGFVGENGSGKSTLLSIIGGLQTMDRGRLFLEGKPYKPSTMIDAQDHGVAMIVQERGTVSGLSVAENIFIAKESRFARWGVVDRSAMNAAADAMLRRIGADHLHGADRIDRLDFEDRKIVEIARSVNDNPQRRHPGHQRLVPDWIRGNHHLA